ncbi:hypothetical protein DL89DRAFT_259885 [Linderina pennispora]|uniref:RRM domain-containing protein n=1 Tax=Linderina pennispora TaxID=61395 RepID=A0A1Y1VZS2_9FUNG|nr:uncharacterized protein DL89DRAFT_259885 [Linderina pennispora]ORX66761.1 hypothetical protein DL89DRAFT_259885 [Linderina pennispora]
MADSSEHAGGSKHDSIPRVGDSTEERNEISPRDRRREPGKSSETMADSFLKNMGQTLMRKGAEARDMPRRSSQRGDSYDYERRRDYRRSSRHDRSRDQSYRRRSRSGERHRYRSRRSRSRSRSREVVPLHLRPKKLSAWDQAPAGFEHVSAAEAKASGVFPPPGQAVGSRNVASFNPSVLFEHTHREENARFRPSSRGEREFPSTASRQARRIYVGNIPLAIDEDAIAGFFNGLLVQLGIAPAHELPVVNIQISHDKNYAFVELRDAEQATQAMGMDGVVLQGQKLKIRRPKDYIPPEGQAEPPRPALGLPGVLSASVPDSPNKIYVGGLAHVSHRGAGHGAAAPREALPSASTPTPASPTLPARASMAWRWVTAAWLVQRASIGARSAHAPPQPVQLDYAPPVMPPAAPDAHPTQIIQLLNMVTAAELADPDEYADIVEDPRPGRARVSARSLSSFAAVDEATTALRALAGRKFADRTVVASYMADEDFDTKNY